MIIIAASTVLFLTACMCCICFLLFSKKRSTVCPCIKPSKTENALSEIQKIPANNPHFKPTASQTATTTNMAHFSSTTFPSMNGSTFARNSSVPIPIGIINDNEIIFQQQQMMNNSAPNSSIMTSVTPTMLPQPPSRHSAKLTPVQLAPPRYRTSICSTISESNNAVNTTVQNGHNQGISFAHAVDVMSVLKSYNQSQLSMISQHQYEQPPLHQRQNMSVGNHDEIIETEGNETRLSVNMGANEYVLDDDDIRSELPQSPQDDMEIPIPEQDVGDDEHGGNDNNNEENDELKLDNYHSESDLYLQPSIGRMVTGSPQVSPKVSPQVTPEGTPQMGPQMPNSNQNSMIMTQLPSRDRFSI